MLFQSKPSVILYLRRQDAVLITKTSSARLNLPLEVVYNLEVRDAPTLTEVISQFLQSHKIRGQLILIVLDASVVFQKTLALQGINAQAATQDFASKLPFEAEAKQTLAVTEKDQLILQGVNRLFCRAVAAGVLKQNKLKVVAAAAAFGIHEGKKIDRTSINALFHNSISRDYNFLTKV